MYKRQEGLYTKLELLVQKVSSPEFERSTDNPKQNTVDRIRVEVSLPKYRLSRQELLAEIKAHKSEIDNLVLEKIVQSKRFQKYGVPINLSLIHIFCYIAAREEGEARAKMVKEAATDD